MVTLSIQLGPEGKSIYSPVELHLQSQCDGSAINTVELYNQEDSDGNKYIGFTPLCLAVEFYGEATLAFSTNEDTLEVALQNPENRPAEYQNSRTRMKFMENLDSVKIEYRKVTARVNNLGWTPASGTDGEVINFKKLDETIDGVSRAIWDISNLPDYEYEVRLKSECLQGNNALPLKLIHYYSDPIFGLIDKSAPQVFGNPQPSRNLAP